MPHLSPQTLTRGETPVVPPSLLLVFPIANSLIFPELKMVLLVGIPDLLRHCNCPPNLVV